MMLFNAQSNVKVNLTKGTGLDNSNMSKLERDFQKNLIKEIKERIPDAIVKKNDPRYIQGIPDISVDVGPYSFHLECKKNANAPYQPNQEYYLQAYNDNDGWARTIYPENKGEILDEMEQSLRARRKTRIS